MTNSGSTRHPGRTWAITTTTGYTASGYLPAWADEDPSKTGVAPERLHIELSDVTHEASFGGQFMRVGSNAADPGQDSPVLIAHMQCSPYAGDDPQARIPVVSIQIADDLWIMNLDQSGVTQAAEKFHHFADLLVNKVAPELARPRRLGRTPFRDRSAGLSATRGCRFRAMGSTARHPYRPHPPTVPVPVRLPQRTVRQPPLGAPHRVQS